MKMKFPFLKQKHSCYSIWLLTIIVFTIFLGHCQFATSFFDKKNNWLRYRGPSGNGTTQEEITPPLAIRWRIPLQAKIDKENFTKSTRAFNPPLIEDDIIYFGSIDKNFYALDLKSGYMRWIFPTKNEVNSVPYLSKERIYFGSNDGRLYAVNKNSGKQVWSFQSGNTIQSLVSGWQDQIIFTSDQGATFFLDQESGEQRHKIANEIWSHHTFQIYDGVIYWAPFRGGFGAYDIVQEKFLWVVNVQSDRAIWYSYPALDDERVYFASSSLSISPIGLGSEIILTYYALDRRTGAVRWKQKNNFEFPPDVQPTTYNGFFRHIELLDYLTPALFDDTVIFTSGDRIVRAFAKKDGRLIWKTSLNGLTSSAPTIAGDRLYFGVHLPAVAFEAFAVRAELMCLSADNGKVEWQTELDGAILSAPVIANDAIYVGTDKNIFYVFEEVFSFR